MHESVFVLGNAGQNGFFCLPVLTFAYTFPYMYIVFYS